MFTATVVITSSGISFVSETILMLSVVVLPMSARSLSVVCHRLRQL
jgi:hypothetical protein